MWLVGERGGVEPVGQGWELVETHVQGVPLCEAGAVTLVVAAAKMYGDEARECSVWGGVVECCRGRGLEDDKVARDGGLDEG